MIAVNIKKLFFIVIWIFVFVKIAGAQQETKIYNWLANPPKVQLDMEGADDIKGLGRIFLPAMTNSDFEPVYTVFQHDSVIKVQKMGKSVWLRPGRYTLAYGSGTLAQTIKKDIEIRAEETRIIEPDWSGLTVRIIDETREWLKEAYEIFRLPAGIPFGVGYGADEQLGENLQTWILQPGLYKITKLGEHLNTYVDFATVRLLPGELTQYTIVMDSETKTFRGAGILEFGPSTKKTKNWTTFSAFYGSLTLNRFNDVTTKEPKTNMAFVAQMDYNLKYSTNKRYFLSRGLIEEGWNMLSDRRSFRSFLDNVRLKNLYIRSIWSWVGFYSRLFMESNFFNTKIYFDEPTTVQYLDENGELERTQHNLNQITLSPFFSPLELKEGFGINLQLLKSFRSNLNVRAGMGYRQNINWRLYTQDENEPTIFRKKTSTYLRGPEAAFIASYRIFRNIMIVSEFDMLIPADSDSRITYDWENNINFRLSKNISIDYKIRIKKDPSVVDYTQTEQILLLRYSYILF